MDARFCAACNPRQPQSQSTPKPSTSRTRATPSRSSALLKYHFDSDRELVLQPQVRDGWRFHTTTWCFSELTTIDSLEDRRVAAQVSIFPRPSCAQDAAVIPELFDHEDMKRQYATAAGGAEWRRAPLGYHVRGGELSIVIELLGDDDGFNPALKWRADASGRFYVHSMRSLTAARWRTKDGGLPPSGWTRELELHVRLVTEPRPFVSPISREWSRRFFPGGLPSLGKRK